MIHLALTCKYCKRKLTIPIGNGYDIPCIYGELINAYRLHIDLNHPNKLCDYLTDNNNMFITTEYGV